MRTSASERGSSDVDGTAGRRLVKASEQALKNLRIRTFRHIHALSIAEQSEEKRGVFVARVTADVDALQQFMEWGGIAWIISIALAMTGMQWYLLFNIIAGASAIPRDLRDTTDLLRLGRTARWRTLILPSLFPFIVTLNGLFVPLASPLQPPNTCPAPGTAVSVTFVPFGYRARSGLRVIAPLPVVEVFNDRETGSGQIASSGGQLLHSRGSTSRNGTSTGWSA
jgi:ABC-type multidrug transport system fused ATPase/permease subunit